MKDNNLGMRSKPSLYDRMEDNHTVKRDDVREIMFDLQCAEDETPSFLRGVLIPPAAWHRLLRFVDNANYYLNLFDERQEQDIISIRESEQSVFNLLGHMISGAISFHPEKASKPDGYEEPRNDDNDVDLEPPLVMGDDEE